MLLRGPCLDDVMSQSELTTIEIYKVYPLLTLFHSTGLLAHIRSLDPYPVFQRIVSFVKEFFLRFDVFIWSFANLLKKY